MFSFFLNDNTLLNRLATLHASGVGFQVVRCGFSGGIVSGQYEAIIYIYGL